MTRKKTPEISVEDAARMAAGKCQLCGAPCFSCQVSVLKGLGVWPKKKRRAKRRVKK